MDRRSWVLFLSLTLVWGTNYLLIKVCLTEMSPAAMVWARVVLGALALLPMAAVSGQLASLRGHLTWLIVLAVIEIVLPFFLIAGGEQYITSSLTGILIAVEPVAVAVLALGVVSAERLSRMRLFGMLSGLTGVGIILGLSVPDRAGLLGGAMVLTATALYAAGALLIKARFSDVPPVATAGASLAIASFILTPIALHSAGSSLPSPRILAAVAILGVASDGLGLLAWFALISRAGPSRAALITYTTPVVALVLGVTLRSEPVTLATGLGTGLILAGSRIAMR